MSDNKAISVCIATWYGPANFGTGLQAVALKHYLEILGYKPFFVEDKRNCVNYKIENKKNKKYFQKIMKFIDYKWVFRILYRDERKVKEIMQNNFIFDYTNVFTIKNDDDVDKLNEMTHIFIAGGDQIWNPYVLNDIFLLSIAKNGKRKFSFGTSVGVKSIPKEYWPIYQSNISTFEAVCVREEQSKNALEELIDTEIIELTDPTVLLNAEEWRFLTDYAEIDCEKFNEKYILCYFVGKRKNYWKYVKKVQRETGYKVIVLPINNENYVNFYSKYVKVTPKEFLWIIKHAEIICTDSYHATLFAIQYQKEFYTLKRFADTSDNSQNGRLSNLLFKLGLKERLIEDERHFVRKSIEDYNEIIEKLSDEREAARRWLEKRMKG